MVAVLEIKRKENNMKERIKKIIIVLLIMAGIVLIGTLMHAYLPIWARCIVWGMGLIWLLYDVSKPEKEQLHYWLYHSIIREEERITIGVLMNNRPTFSLTGKEFDLKKSLIFSAVEIDKETFDMIEKIIDEANKDQNNE